MSYGKMKDFIELVLPSQYKDKDGVLIEERTILARVRAYREGRHGNVVWANRATFTSATELFRFRVIPNLEVTTSMIILCNGSEFEITSVEDVKGKNMYIEVLAIRWNK